MPYVKSEKIFAYVYIRQDETRCIQTAHHVT